MSSGAYVLQDDAPAFLTFNDAGSPKDVSAAFVAFLRAVADDLEAGNINLVQDLHIDRMWERKGKGPFIRQGSVTFKVQQAPTQV